MRNTPKDFIKRRFVNIMVIIVISFFFSIIYLGLHQSHIEPIEKTEQIEVVPES